MIRRPSEGTLYYCYVFYFVPQSAAVPDFSVIVDCLAPKTGRTDRAVRMISANPAERKNGNSGGCRILSVFSSPHLFFRCSGDKLLS